MKLFNLEDLTLFGAGSEWFWTMLTMIALSVTFVAIYRQLRAQRAAVAFEQLQALTDEWQSDRIRYRSHRLAVGLRRGDPYDELELFLALPIFFEKLSLLHNQGYLDTEVLYVTFGEDIVRWWTVTAGLVGHLRTVYENPGELALFERLANKMRAMMAKRGVPPFETDPASIAGRLDWIIDGYRRGLAIDREFREWRMPSTLETPLRS